MHHRRPARDPALDRRLLPPVRDQRVEHTGVDHAAVHVLAAGERPALEQHHRAPGAGERRARRTRRPDRRRRRSASTSAIVGDLPLGRAADGELGRASASSTALASATIGQVGELHHRAVRVGVHADDVRGLAEAAGVLHRAADAEGEVESRVDDDARGADLAFVADPPRSVITRVAPIDAPRRGGDLARAARSARRESSPAPPPTMRGASARSIVVTSGARTSSTTASGRPPSRERGRGDLDASPRRGAGSTPRTPGCSVATNGPARDDVLDHEAAPARDRGAGDGDLDGAGEQGSSERVGEARCEVAPVGAGGQHDDVVVEVGQQRGGRRCRAGAGRQLEHAHVAGAELTRRQLGAGADQQGAPGALGGSLGATRGEAAVANGDHGEHDVGRLRAPGHEQEARRPRPVAQTDVPCPASAAASWARAVTPSSRRRRGGA